MGPHFLSADSLTACPASPALPPMGGVCPLLWGQPAATSSGAGPEREDEDAGANLGLDPGLLLLDGSGDCSERSL